MTLSAEPLAPTLTAFPDICGNEARIEQAMADPSPVFLADSGVDFARINSAAAVALHMHQPLIPAEGSHSPTSVIGNLQFMFEHPEVQDSHNAPVFLECYRRMGDLIPQLVHEGKQPRIMLDYSGCLFHGLQAMGAQHAIDALAPLAQNPAYRRCVEYLGTTWGHAVAPSTPVQDFRLHVRAWQHHFASLFGIEALKRVRGFSPPEMALPNHPDVCYEFVKTLLDCGYRWVLVQEHSVESIGDGNRIRTPHIPHRLVARNSSGQTLSIPAIIKTQGSDTKLVGQMQPYFEARSLSRAELAGQRVPPLVTQIGDGENGGVMMNEFPPKYLQVVREADVSQTCLLNATEYLEHLYAAGIREADLPSVQPVFQQRIWDRFKPAEGSAQLDPLIKQLRTEDNRFHMDGGSWTNNISWVAGYESVLNPMNRVSAQFAEKFLRPGVATSSPRYRRALFYLLTTQTSCFRYWGQGGWTDRAHELCRMALEAQA